jgi:hypothetical protein
MRYLTYHTADRNRIDIRNSFLGEESIYYNGKIVSKKTSLFGSLHEFRVIENDEKATYRINIEYRWPLRIGFDIYRNGRALLVS